MKSSSNQYSYIFDRMLYLELVPCTVDHDYYGDDDDDGREPLDLEVHDFECHTSFAMCFTFS